MDRKTGKRVRQVVLLNRRESPQEQKHFLDNLSRNSKFQNLLGRLYPSNQELGARELMGLILAARTDSFGLLRYVSSTAKNQLYSRALRWRTATTFSDRFGQNTLLRRRGLRITQFAFLAGRPIPWQRRRPF